MDTALLAQPELSDHSPQSNGRAHGTEDMCSEWVDYSLSPVQMTLFYSLFPELDIV